MKPTAQRRRDRRALLDNLLARMLRGQLTTAEAALLAESVREEQRAYDQTRRSLGETTTALTRHREAADAAIREMEQRALDAEEQLTAYRSVLGPRPLDTIRAAEQRADQAEAVAAEVEQGDAAAVHLANSAAATWQQRAEQAEDLLRVAHQSSNEAERQRADAERRLTAQQQRHEDRRRALAAALDVDPATLWPQLVDIARTAAHLGQRAEQTLAEAAAHRHQAVRYRLAWIAARRDRKADRAAMAAELPLAAAGREALTIANELFLAGRTDIERETGRRILAAAHAAAEQPPTAPQHTGGNAEHCPACPNTNPPYPFLCPATPTAAQEA
ncbi:hypothetical protein [Streptomyces levis]|uniref:hypothetical protein n=1 Tax=Streptomyces levis TaxID=285566 RepID=UPI003C79E7DD